MRSVTRHAHAKLNAFLRVLGRRPDGFHELQTAILPIELYDVVTVEEHDGLVIEVMGERAGELQRAGGESLVGRAAHAWATAAGVGAPRARIVDARARYATRTLTAPYASSPGRAASRSPTSRCIITTDRTTFGTRANTSSTSGVAML